MNTSYPNIVAQAEKIFKNKLNDYGPSWRVLRPIAIADQIFIKAYRIRTIQEKKEQKVEDSIYDDFLGIYNYGIIAYIQYTHPEENKDWDNLSHEDALNWYNLAQKTCNKLYEKKNADYGDAWKQMTVQGITDLILAKIYRIRQIILNKFKTTISEGIESHFLDIANYAIFILMKNYYAK